MIGRGGSQGDGGGSYPLYGGFDSRPRNPCLATSPNGRRLSPRECVSVDDEYGVPANKRTPFHGSYRGVAVTALTALPDGG